MTWDGSFEARVFGYIKGASVSTNKRSNGIAPSSKSFLTPASDLSLHRYPKKCMIYHFISKQPNLHLKIYNK